MSLYFCCSKKNDFYQLFVKNNPDIECYDNLDEVLIKAEKKSGIFLLSDTYPICSGKVTEKHLKTIKEKSLRIYIEYPESVEGMEFTGVSQDCHKRIVISTDSFDNLPYGSIMMANDLNYITCNTDKKSYALFAKVAGYDRIKFGIPNNAVPILIEFNENVLIGCGGLSYFVKGRFSPKNSWKVFFEEIAKWLVFNQKTFKIEYELTVSPAFCKYETLPSDYEGRAVYKNCNWLRKNMLVRDGKWTGVAEGFVSEIKYDGKQMFRNSLRADCNAECSLVFALKSIVNKDQKAELIYEKLLDFVFSDEFFKNDVTSSEYGLLSWMRGDRLYYGDDNARALLAVLCLRNITGNSKWDDKILKCIMANFRTGDKDGFRYNSLSGKDFDEKEWKYYHDIKQKKWITPHFQCYLWAVYLWAYELTGYEKFKDVAKKGIYATMDVYPNGWLWTNSITAEISRMILPLSFLLRVENTEIHRNWLYCVVDDILKQMDECGAIKDRFGDLKMGKYPPPQSNEDYGTTEASLIQENGDPATDLLYTVNWALVGLHEAAFVTCDKRIKDAEDKLCEFLCRIQISSVKHPELDGAWSRSFDFDKWELYGSGADNDWGAWCIETGWTNSWISSVLFLRKLNRPLMTCEAKDDFRKISPDIIREMLDI